VNVNAAAVDDDEAQAWKGEWMEHLQRRKEKPKKVSVA